MAKDNGNKPKQSFIAAILAALFGKSQNGFLPEVVKSAANDGGNVVALPVRRALETEQDGRKYAIAMLQKMQEQADEVREKGLSFFGANAEEVHADTGEVAIYRHTPQGDTLHRWLEDLYCDGTPQAVNGFQVILTDYLGVVMDGSVPNCEEYAKQEAAGGFSPWGSVIYSHPELAAEAIKKGEDSYWIERKATQQEQQPEPQEKKSGKAQIADELERTCVMSLHALLDWGRSFQKIGVTDLTARDSVMALTFSVRASLRSLEATLPAKHKARKKIQKALTGMDDLDAFMDDTTEDAEMMLSPRGKARCIYAFALDIACAFEEVQEAIGGSAEVGFREFPHRPEQATNAQTQREE